MLESSVSKVIPSFQTSVKVESVLFTAEIVRMVSKVTKKLTQTQSTYSVTEADLPSLVKMVAMEIRGKCC